MMSDNDYSEAKDVMVSHLAEIKALDINSYEFEMKSRLKQEPTWILDFGVTIHVTSNSNILLGFKTIPQL